MEDLEQLPNEILTQWAKAAGFRGRGWYTIRHTARARRYVCGICRALIDSDSVRYRPTKHAQQAIVTHGQQHLEGKED